MAIQVQNISLPTAGEPIDLSFMTTLGQYIIDINQELISLRTAFSSLYSENRLTAIQTEDVSIWTDKIPLPAVFPANTTPTPQEWSRPFDVTFKAIPIVVATAHCDSAGGLALSCWIKRVDTTGVTGAFKFDETPTRDETVFINVIAIGPGSVG